MPFHVRGPLGAPAGSPNPLPKVRGSQQQALYPLTRSIEFLTSVNQAANGAEQRYAKRAPLVKFRLPYSTLSYADTFGAQGQFTWFDAATGMFAINLSLSIDTLNVTNVYTDLALEQDTFDATAQDPAGYDTMVTLRQVKNPAWSPPMSPPTAFPALGPGEPCQYPLSIGTRYLTWTNDMESGYRYALSAYQGGFTDFPTGGLQKWRLEYPVLTEDLLAILENFFMGVQGRLGKFTFTDPISQITFDSCRLDQDALEIRYDGPHGQGGHQVSTSLTVAQFFTPTRL